MKSLDDTTIDYGSKYEKMCQRLARHLSEDDIESLKFTLRKRVGKVELDKIKDGREFVQMLEKENILSEEKIPHVKSLLRNAGVERVDDIINEYPLVPDRISKQDGFDIKSMNVVSNFRETEQLRKMVEIVKTKRAVLVKGPNGCGKSQNAFWYARHFQSENPFSIVWRVHCKSERSMYLSFATLMSHLKIECILSDYDPTGCILTMLDLAIANLTNQRNVQRKHLIVLDDMESPEDAVVYNAMDKFIRAENIYVVATSNKRFLPDHFEIYGMEMDKMTEQEALSLFSFSSKSEEKQLKLLAKNLDYLPLALSLAASYIKITHISVKEYNKNLLGSQLQADTLGTQRLARSYRLTLERLDNDITNISRGVLAYVSYLNHNNISVTLLKSFLPDQLSNGEKEVEINRLLLALTDYSLAAVEGVGEHRILSMHNVSCLMIENSKSEKQITEDVNFLLKHYCYNLDTEARFVESMKRNICFIHHAVLLLRKYSRYFDGESFETKIYESYLCCAVGVTFRLYGSTELSADDYFARAKQILFEEIALPLPERSLHTGVVSKLEDYLYGSLVEQEEARQVFLKLLEKSSTHISIEFVESFLTNKIRNSREIQLLAYYGHINPQEMQNNKLPLHIIKNIAMNDIVVPFEMIRKTFLIDMLIVIMNNSSKNRWWMENAKDSETFGSRNSHHEDQGQQIDSLTEFRFAHNLAQYLNNFYHEHCPTCIPLASKSTKRNGILYFLRSNEKIESEELMDVIISLDEMYNSSASTFYVSFGVLKMGPKFNLHHRCLITRMLVKCYVKLWENDGSPNDLSEALFQAEKLAVLAEEMGKWFTVTSIYLEIAQTFILNPTKHNIEKAKLYYKQAYESAKESGNIQNTNYHLKLYLKYINFSLEYGNTQDLEAAKQICLEMQERFIQNETKHIVHQQLIRIEEKLSKPKYERISKLFGMAAMFVCMVVLIAAILWSELFRSSKHEL